MTRVERKGITKSNKIMINFAYLQLYASYLLARKMEKDTFDKVFLMKEEYLQWVRYIQYLPQEANRKIATTTSVIIP